MDENFDPLELELKRLRPRPLSPSVLQGIESDLTSRPGPLRRARWIIAAVKSNSRQRRIWGASAAALLLIFLGVRLTRAPEMPQAAALSSMPSPAPGAAIATRTELKPVTAESILYEVRDEGLVTLDDGRSGRRIRQSYLDTITWSDSAARRSVRWTVPREEVRILPVVFQ